MVGGEPVCEMDKIFQLHSVRWAAGCAYLVPLAGIQHMCVCVVPLAIIAIHLISLLPSTLLYILLL